MPGEVASVAGRMSGIGRARANRRAQNGARPVAAPSLGDAAIVARAIRCAIAVGVACDPSAA
jgi:NAD(P)-dependent dehydrogenase (short-subunit alcohol dehydrogenase family)